MLVAFEIHLSVLFSQYYDITIIILILGSHTFSIPDVNIKISIPGSHTNTMPDINIIILISGSHTNSIPDVSHQPSIRFAFSGVMYS